MRNSDHYQIIYHNQQAAMKRIIRQIIGLWMLVVSLPAYGQLQYMGILNEPVDISKDFFDFTNTYYFADSLSHFDPVTGQGLLIYRRFEYATRQAFDNMMGVPVPVQANEFPGTEYAASPALPFTVSFVSPRTIRIRAFSGFVAKPEEPSLMLVNGTAPLDKQSWTYTQVVGGCKYTSESGSLTIQFYPFHVEIRDAKGHLLTSTVHNNDFKNTDYTPVMPFSFVRRASDYSRSYNAVFRLFPDEKIFGCGESFTRLDKRGQKIVLWTDDANGVQNETMYKPIPFYMSNRGYGMFVHSSSPMSWDFGKYFNEVSSLMIGDDQLDLFIFLGSPKEILDEYTDLTGKAAMPPLWSFGLWMSRITYFSEEEGRIVAALLRKNRIPSDVIHFDTGWFETDWRCDYNFSKSRFPDPAKMIADLRKMGFHISLWQLPYFTPNNVLFDEIISKGLYVRNASGNIPYEDATLDFSNPATISWYQDKIAGLLNMGVGAIKVDFGEAAPANGIYYSGKTGFYEHNLYPLRYNKTVADITRQVTGDNIIWARSSWAGSQRYPLHWGGDAANTNNAMECELRGGLSFGLSGFSFWSHDIGGFVQKSPADLYLRWLPFGMLSSHSRCHGTPPKEPWEYGEAFNNAFRKGVELKYKLMPYVYAQAKQCTETGLPMVRALFIEYPDDPGAWYIDNEYLFGSDILVSPLFENTDIRDVYLPGGNWVDYQSGILYTQGWHQIKTGEIQAIILVREGAVIPHIKLAQSTQDMDWSKIDLVVYSRTTSPAKGIICLPKDNVLKTIILKKKGSTFNLVSDPYSGQVNFTIMPVKLQ
jgi:alpha-D-xyloside xylohydrolase